LLPRNNQEIWHIRCWHLLVTGKTRKYGEFDADTCLLPGNNQEIWYIRCWHCLLPGNPGNMANSMLTLACYWDSSPTPCFARTRPSLF
jgi:hypothetical protein